MSVMIFFYLFKNLLFFRWLKDIPSGDMSVSLSQRIVMTQNSTIVIPNQSIFQTTPCHNMQGLGIFQVIILHSSLHYDCIIFPTVTICVVLFVDYLNSSSGSSDGEEEPPFVKETRPSLQWYNIIGPDSAKETRACTEREEYSEVDTPIYYFQMFFHRHLLNQITRAIKFVCSTERSK